MKGRRTLDGRSPAAHRLEAKVRASRLPLARPGIASGLSAPKDLFAPPPGPSCDWSVLGPAPQVETGPGSLGKISGRVTSLALDLTHDATGNTLYLGAAYGGVWKSTNALAGSPSFTSLSDQTKSLAVGAIAVDGSHTPPYLYIGTGEANMSGDCYYGVGILTSQDGGSTWNQVSTATSGGGSVTFLGVSFSKILVDPASPATVLAATAFGCCESGLNTTDVGAAKGIFYSSNSGATWTQVTSASLNTHSCTDLVYDGSATFFAAVRGMGLFYSTNAIAWTSLPSPFPSGTAPTAIGAAGGSNFARATLASRGATLWCLVANENANPSTPGAGDTGLSQSTDGGQTWTAVNLPPGNLFNAGGGAQGDYDQYVAAPPGATSLLVAGIDVWKTSTVNGTSTSWTNFTNSYSGNPSSHPDQHAFVFASAVTWFIGNDGGVWSTSNGGTNLTNINSNLNTIQFYSASPDSNNGGSFSGGSQDNGTAYTNASSGVTWTEVLGGDGGFTDFNASVPGELFAENFNVGVYRSANNGTDGFPFTVVDAGTIADNSEFYVPYKVVPGVPGQIVLGASHVWRGPANSTNGSGWASISQNFSSGGIVVALDTGTSNPNYIYATTDDGGGTYNVFGNGGASGTSTWSNITSNLPTGSPIAGIAVDPVTPTTLYVGIQGFVGSPGSGHLYQLTNSSTSWTDITGNLPDAPVNWIVVDPLYATDIYVANDVGVFYTNALLGGSTSWARVGTTLPDSTVLQLKMGSCPNRTLVAATHGRGAWSICPISTYVCPSPTMTFTPTITFTPTNTPVSVPFVAQAQPNITDGQTVVHFAVGLPKPMTLTLAVYDVADEAIYAQAFSGNTGPNDIPWKPTNQNGLPLASGVYLYHLRADDGSTHYDKVGKILVRP